jgi:hypothetical protein
MSFPFNEGLDHFQDFRVFHFFNKEFCVPEGPNEVVKNVGVIQCKADFMAKGMMKCVKYPVFLFCFLFMRSLLCVCCWAFFIKSVWGHIE